MHAICAWCQADLGERPGPEGVVTHGICPACLAAVRAGRYERDKARLAEGHSLSLIRCECPCGCETMGTSFSVPDPPSTGTGCVSLCSECALRGHYWPSARVAKAVYFPARGEEERPVQECRCDRCKRPARLAIVREADDA